MKWRSKAIDYDINRFIKHNNVWITHNPYSVRVSDHIMSMIYHNLILANDKVMIPNDGEVYGSYMSILTDNVILAIKRLKIHISTERFTRLNKIHSNNLKVVILGVYKYNTEIMVEYAYTY